MSDLAWWTVNFGLLFEIVGTIGFALSGLIEAARKKLDVVGVCMVTAVAAFGGGTLRDILLNRRPLFWVQNDWWIWAILIFCVLAFVFVRGRHLEFTERAMQWPDAIGLGVFAASGTQIALISGTPEIVAVIMGVMTAVFGGILRDIFTNQIPRAFSDHQPYTVVGFGGSWIVVIGFWLDWPAIVSVALASLVIILVRVAVMVFGWRLPQWRV